MLPAFAADSLIPAAHSDLFCRSSLPSSRLPSPFLAPSDPFLNPNTSYSSYESDGALAFGSNRARVVTSLSRAILAFKDERNLRKS